MPRPKFVAGNWKMYTTAAGSKGLAAAIANGLGEDKRVMVGIFPPFPWLLSVVDIVRGSQVMVGAQNCHFEREGAFTGEISPTMLRDAGCDYVIIGHSERRHGLGETNEVLNQKVKAALAANLKVIFCVGELLTEREALQTNAVLDEQLSIGLANLPASDLDRLVIAYEPVWAIGTGQVATPEQAQEAHAHIRQKFAEMYGEKAASELLIQYGGSVKPDNAATLLHLPDVDGALVGGASLKADSFLAIVRAAH